MENAIRRIAQSYRYQFLYNRMRELGNIRLFENNIDLTPIQISFLQWLEVYRMLYLDLAEERDYISEEVIKDEIRTEAYLLYRNKDKQSKEKEIDDDSSEKIPKVIFKRGK